MKLFDSIHRNVKYANIFIIANVVLFVITIVAGIIDYFVDAHRFQDPSPLCGVSWILLWLSLLCGTISWIYNIIVVLQHTKLKWLYWLNTILSVIAGYYVLLFIITYLSELYFIINGSGWHQVDRLYFSHPEFLLYALQSSWSIITVCLSIAWLVQYIINSVFIIKAYAENKQTKD